MRLSYNIKIIYDTRVGGAKKAPENCFAVLINDEAGLIISLSPSSTYLKICPRNIFSRTECLYPVSTDNVVVT